MIENDFDYCLFKLFNLPSSMILIVGDWKTGKTDFALLIAERLLELNIVSKIASNIYTKDDRIIFISDLPTLRSWLHGDKTRKLYIFDEVGMHLHKRRSMSRKNIAFMTILPEISKARARLICIMQNPESIDKELISPVWCKGLIIKDNLYKAKFISELFPGDQKVFEFNPVPKTTIPFDPYAIAPFELSSPKDIPDYIKKQHLEILWEWAVNNKTIHKLGLHPMQLHRIVKRFVKQVLETQSEFTLPSRG